MKLWLLACVCAASVGLSMTTPTVRRVDDWPDDLEQSVRGLRADIKARLALLEGSEDPADHAAVAPDRGRLVIRDRAGKHVFKMRDGFAVDAQLGADRVYRVRDGFFFSEICVCGGEAGRGCARRYKPAFYCLVAAACLLVVLAVAFACSEAVRRRKLQRRSAAAGDRCRLLVKGVDSCGDHAGLLAVKCNPVSADGCLRYENKVAI